MLRLRTTKTIRKMDIMRAREIREKIVNKRELQKMTIIQREIRYL